jgi:hypothetical protein
MTNEKNILYRKAYVELLEIIKFLPKKYKDKIPKKIIDNLCKNMDKNYSFKMDKTKGLLEQNYTLETKALLVELYERYLAIDSEKDFWENYDRICLKMIEDKK